MLKRLLGNRESSDLVNPVLLKELKQAVRSKQFVGVFVTVQIAMILFVIFVMAAATGASNMEEINAFFWSIVGVYLLFILPLSGLNALGREFDDARLDLLQLSCMRSRGIVFGKWLSLNFQGLLVVLSLLPYIVLRYFTGAVNPLYDLITLSILLYFSLIFSGLAICVSVVKGKILRVLVAIGLCIGVIILVNIFDNTSLLRSNPLDIITGDNFYVIVPLILLITILSGGLLLEFASARISPLAENHETPKRFYLIGLFIMWCLAYLTQQEATMALALFSLSLALIAVSISCMVNEPVALPGIYCPFLRRGSVLRALSRIFLYPGWPSGASFVVMMFAAYTATVFYFDRSGSPGNTPKFMLMILGVVGSLLMPRAIFVIFRMRNGGVRLFMLVQLVLICVCVLAMLTEEVKKWPITDGLFWLPQAGVLCLGLIKNNSTQLDLYLIGNAAVAIFSYIIIIVVGSARMKAQQSALEAQAQAINERKKAEQQATADAAHAEPIEA
ncbi:ABC transporter permease [Cerasicoccus maritimus]|uniref:ABC transporter permease n=1 Tax=Cerasicoccus maritimus TaxID=490089 RepID=UPI002852B471|nr:hypothetical protein [Cerasicoccus maritimus]